MKRQNSNSGDPETEMLILERASKLKVPAGMQAEEALSLLKSRIEAHEKEIPLTVEKNHRLIYLVSSVAAGLLILLAIWQVWFNSTTTVIAERGSHREFRLPDGSVARLNAESRISFRNKSYLNDRHLKLQGEAFFDVVKGSGFTVSTMNGDVKVLGTSFNVNARDDSFTVNCLTGKILISSHNQSVTITPGESARVEGTNLINYTDAGISRATSWLEGEFIFENSPLESVFREIERQFNVKFTANNFKDKFFTGSFSNKDLQTALEIICIPMGLSYEIGSNNKISVTENPD